MTTLELRRPGLSPRALSVFQNHAAVKDQTFVSSVGTESYIPIACLLMTSCLASDTTIKGIIDHTLSEVSMLLASCRTPESADELPAVRQHARIAELIGLLCQTLLDQNGHSSVVAERLEEGSNDPIAEAVRVVVRAIINTLRMGSPLRHIPHGNAVEFPTLAEALTELRRKGHETLAMLLAAIATKTIVIAPKSVGLSKSELTILKQLAGGSSPAAIAQERCSSVATVRAHIKNILRKLNVNRQAAAIARARTIGLIS
jgi:DNA-binding CsgD family transcriptional regulator